MKKIKSLLFGIILVAAGVLFALNSLDILSFDLFFDGWWSLFIIIPCAVGLITEKEKTGNLIGLFIGIALLLGALDILSFDLIWKLLIPAIIIIVGVKMVFRSLFSKTEKEIAEISANQKSDRNSYALFSGNDMIVDGEIFEGAELNAIFGGVKCDLRNAIIEKDCCINASAIFGGIDILVGDNVNVKIKSTSVFGGMSNKTAARENCPTLYVSGVCIFGGIDIK